MGPGPLVERVRSYLSSEVWGDRPGDGGPRRPAIARAIRIAYSTARGLLDHNLTFRAAALTYYTVLSIVPFLAFAFALVKGFGAYRLLVDGTIRPWVQGSFGANPALLLAIGRVLDFVDQTDVSKLGALGLLMLVYTSLSLVSSVETALNRIWGARASRTFLRQVTDYVTLLVTAPLLVLVAATLSTAAQSSWFVEFLRSALHLGPVIDLAVRLTPLLVVFLAIFSMYVILPNVRVRPASAAVGAAMAAVLWQGALVLHVQSQRGAAGYNALYSVLGAIPIFLVWTYVSWLVVLVGAELAANHQNERALQQRFLARRADQALRETVAIACATLVAQDFLEGRRVRPAWEIARALAVPGPVVEEVLDALVRAALLARTVAGRDTGYLPARDPGAVRAGDLREAVRREPRADPIRARVERRLGRDVAEVLAGLEDESRRSRFNLTLRELAERAEPEGGDGSPPPPGGAPGADAGSGGGARGRPGEGDPRVPG